jgi:hypothetical protein
MKKIALMSVVLVLVLGTLGVAYAMWSDSVTIRGEVSTDNVAIEWVEPLTSDDPCGSGTLDHTGGPGKDYVQLDKDVACATVTKQDAKHLKVELFNAYPCYCVVIDTHTRNTGSVPVIKEGVKITFPDPYNPGQFLTWDLPDKTWVQIPGPGVLNGVAGIYDVYEIAWGNNSYEQLDPHSWPNVEDEEDSFKIHVLQPALQSDVTSYNFVLTRSAHNWNE